jgi:uncharacterized protein (DUF305 family)
VTVTRSETADTLNGPEDDRIGPLRDRVRRLYVLVIALVLVVVFGAVAVGVSTWARSSTPPQTSPDVGFARDMYTHHGQAVTMALMMRNTVAEPFNTLTEDIITGQAEQQGVMLGWLQDHDVLSADDSWEPMKWMAGTPGMADMSKHGMAPVTPMVSASPAPTPTPAPAPTSMVGWGVMPGMATDAELTRLAGLTGKDREVLFLRLMLRHHRAGTDMARTYLQLGSDEQLRGLAQSVVTSQEREISIMTDLLADRGATEAAQ